MKWRSMLAAGATALAFVACRDSETPSSANANANGNADGGALAVTLPPAGDGGTAAAGNAGNAGGKIVAMAYAASGTLVVQTERGLTTIAPDGTRSELALPPHATTSLSGTLDSSLAVQVDDDVLLVNLSPLGILLRAHGRAIGQAGGADIGLVETTTDGSHDVAVRLLSPGTRNVVRLKLEDGLDGHVDEMAVTPSQHFAVVTVNAEQGGQTSQHSFAYGLATGHRIAEVLPLGQMTLLPNATFAGDHQIGFRGGDLVEIDLESGRTLRKTPFACKSPNNAQAAVGNPILDASGTRLLVTCEWDGVLLDARSFRRVRTYKRVIPGCDNGYALPAHFQDDGKELVVEGCGGEAHLDLASGKYACGDEDELMGKPYEIATPAVAVHRASTPTVPKCRADGTSETAAETMELSPHWRLRWTGDDQKAVVFAARDAKHAASSVPIALDPANGNPAVSPNEDRLAVANGSEVVVRALPSGNVWKQFAF